MARAQAGQFDEALKRFKELMQGLGQNEQEEFAASFADDLATTAITAAEFATAREVYTLLLNRFSESPNLRQKVQNDLKRLDKVGKLAPSFAVEDVKGKTVRLDAYRGKYVLVDFWATWCVHASANFPGCRRPTALSRLGFEIIGISLDESKTAVVDFGKARNIPWPLVHNASGSADLVEAFGVSSIPATYLIDPEGNIIRLDLRGKALDETLRRMIKPPATAVRER